jgi:ketosteroid isomerase-like protein
MGKSSQDRIGRSLLRVGAAFVALSVLIRPLAAAPEDEVRATFDRFVAAQNEHDAKAVEALLLDSPNFLWITRGIPVWGADGAMKRFATLYQGTWHLDPDAASLKVIILRDGVAQLYVPIMFTFGPSGQSAQPTRFLMSQLLVKTATGWKISSILPIPAPAQ